MALLVFIYAEKVIHIHGNVKANDHQVGFFERSNNSVCAICDFALAKEAALPEPVAIDIPFVIEFREFNIFSSSYFHLVASSIANRGPPAA